MIYLDNAATSSPKPECVTKAVLRGMRLSANPGRGGHAATMRAADEIFEVRKLLSGFFGLNKPENVIFTSNCTHSLNTAVRGLVKKGSHVVCSDLEHNSVIRVLEKMRRDGDITYNVAKTYDNDIDTVRSFERCIRFNTAAVVCTHASNVFADILPIKDIGELCRKKGLIFIVDAAQSAGTVNIDMTQMNIDALCIPCHKGLYASMGTGALLLKSDKIEPLLFGGTGSLSQSLEQPDFLPDRLESGTLNLSGIMSIGEGVRFVQSIKPERIHAYENSLCRMLFEYLYQNKNYEVLSRYPDERSAAIVSFRQGDKHSEETAELLGKHGFCVRGGFHCAYTAHKSRKTETSGLVRVSPCIFNNEDEIKKLINFLNQIEKSQLLCYY